MAPSTADSSSNNNTSDKERKRKKQVRKMSKLLSAVWQLVEDATVHDELAAIGRKLDAAAYSTVGKSGWTDFARDLGAVFTMRTLSSTSKPSDKAAVIAKQQLQQVETLLGNVHASLAKIAATATTSGGGSSSKRTTGAAAAASPHAKKRKTDQSGNNYKDTSGTTTTSVVYSSATTTSTHTNNNYSDTSNSNDPNIQARTVRAMEQLQQFVLDKGGTRSMLDGFTATVHQRRNAQRRSAAASNKYDVNFYHNNTKKFRSMLQVGRHLGVLHDATTSTARSSSSRNSRTHKPPASQEQVATKKKLRKELERLRKAHTRATKALDEWDDKEEPTLLLLPPSSDEVAAASAGVRVVAATNDTTCTTAFYPMAAARIPDSTGFAGFADNCTPDILQTWDFLCTFARALALDPLPLEDFVEALAYTPPEGQLGDDVVAAPVYLAEAHLGLLKLLLTDRSSDDWWWSILETDETEGIKLLAAHAAENGDDAEAGDGNGASAVIRFDLAAALQCAEDPLITQSWLRALEQPQDKKTRKAAVKEALKIVSNKWIAAYLRKCLKVNSSMDGAVDWIVRRYRQARPDLGDASTTAPATTVSQTTVNEARAKAVEDATRHMELLSSTAPRVADEEVVSEWEEEDDEESDDEEEDTPDTAATEEEKLASALPPKPLPTFVDMLLPPEKPTAFSEFLNPFTWSHLAGATAARVVHRKKRLMNECDDGLREAAGLPHLTTVERREREAQACARFLTECCIDVSDIEKNIIQHLCTGGNYLDLSPTERLCLLRILMEASYDTVRVHEVVTGNFKQKLSAERALDVEQRRAKREAKEKASADEQTARERLAEDVKLEFVEARKEEIRQLNAKSQEFSDDVIDSLTEEDIIDFDDDFKADFEALPDKESFSKQEVSQMVVKLQEEAAFDTNSLEVLTIEEVELADKAKLEEMKEQLASISGDGSQLDESWDRDTVRSIDRLKRNIERAESEMESLPAVREAALQILREALEEGTIKVLRAAYATAKKADLVADKSENEGMWAVEEVRAVALELEKAKQNKRVLDAQKDLVAKRNRCFIRADPIGLDRQGNRFWSFSHEAGEDCQQVWTQVEYTPKITECTANQTPSGCVELKKDPNSMEFGVADREEDLRLTEQEHLGLSFSRQEFHSQGFSSKRTQFFWGCHGNEDSLRVIAKSLSAQVDVELALKNKLKESLETDGGGDESADKEGVNSLESQQQGTQDLKTEGDEHAFAEAKSTAMDSDDIDESCVTSTSAIGQSVRVRHAVSENSAIARYRNCIVNGWKKVPKLIPRDEEEGMEIDNQEQQMIEEVSWRAVTENNGEYWLSPFELIESIIRHRKWKNGQGYFEDDAAFFSFRNSLGRHCGKVADAPYAASPSHFAKLMIKRESDLYPKLKMRSYDNTWGGQNGARALWTNSMRDYAYDFETVRQGLATLENAFFELSRGFSEYKNTNESPVDVATILEDSTAVFDLELESMDKDLPGLWNSPTSRAVFLHIVQKSSTTGFLALAFDLLCRNTLKYLQVHKLLHTSPVAAAVPMARVTRRMNAWQQQQQLEGL